MSVEFVQKIKRLNIAPHNQLKYISLTPLIKNIFSIFKHQQMVAIFQLF